jgi:thioester reductase-like protein
LGDEAEPDEAAMGAVDESVSADGEDEALEGETEARLAALWEKLLKLDEATVRARDSFFEIGGHSLLAVRLVAAIRKAWPAARAVKLADVLRHAELRDMAALVERRCGDEGSGDPAAAAAGDEASPAAGDEASPARGRPRSPGTGIDLAGEASLDEIIYPAATRKTGYSRLRLAQLSFMPPKRVLLTGSTGFLGAFLLSELTARTDATVYCVVRAKDDDEAFERVERNLRAYALLPDPKSANTQRDPARAEGRAEAMQAALDLGRVVAVAGDLSRPLLGLSNAAFRELATVIDVIVHNGAEVNLVKPYAALKATNVLGTQEILRLAVTNGAFETRVKPVYYVSTNGVFPYGRGGRFSEAHPTTELRAPLEASGDGYGQTKWVAEQLCLEARSRGLPVCVLRPGNMAGSSATGAWNANDFVRMLLQGCLVLGCVPRGEGTERWNIDLTPVDFAARAIVECVKRPQRSLGRTLHVQSPHPHVAAETAFDWLGRGGQNVKSRGSHGAHDRALKAVPLPEWRKMLDAAADQEAAGGDEAGVLLQSLQAGLDAFVRFWVDPPTLETAEMRAVLSGSNVECPPFDETLMATYKAALLR